MIRKEHGLVLILLCLHLTSFGQNEVELLIDGIIPPRTDTSSVAGVEGMIIYDTITNNFAYFNGQN